MYHDSQIVSDFQLSRAKLAYLINFGIALDFQQMLTDEIKSINFYSVSFNETLSKVSQTSQILAQYQQPSLCTLLKLRIFGAYNNRSYLS